MPISFRPRRGQWVTLDYPHDEAHRTPHGQAVGIFHPGDGMPMRDFDPLRITEIDRIYLVRPDGTNVTVEVNGQMHPLVVPYVAARNVAPLLVNEHIPEGRRFPDGHQIQP